MRRLYLHVGTHKTGTTSLQAYLMDHHAALRAQNIHVLTETHRKFGEIATCLGFAHAILRNEVQTVARMTGDMPSSSSFRAAQYRRHIRRALKNLPDNSSAILSAEALCFARTEGEGHRLAKVLSGLGYDIVPVLCFRNDSDWRASWESELRDWSDRMTRRGAGSDESISGDWYYDRDAIVSFWNTFGPVRCVDFDAAVARDGSILPGLLTALDVPAEDDMDSYVLRQRRA